MRQLTIAISFLLLSPKSSPIRVSVIQNDEKWSPYPYLFLTFGRFPALLAAAAAMTSMALASGAEELAPARAALAAEAAFGSTAIRLNLRFRLVFGRCTATARAAGPVAIGSDLTAAPANQ